MDISHVVNIDDDQVKPATTVRQTPGAAQNEPRKTRKLRIMYLGNLSLPYNHEACLVQTLTELGHEIERFHEYAMPSVGNVIEELNGGGYDCLLFFKGRIGARTLPEILAPTGEEIVEVLRQSEVPCYCWYVDRVLGFREEPTREAWMRRVAPLCRVVFVTDASLTRSTWARWHVLRQGIYEPIVCPLHVPEDQRQEVAFIGQVYGERERELASVAGIFDVCKITDAHGPDLGPEIQRHRIILGPRYPSQPGYWSNRIYLVLGHGGFFLAPEVEGMREEGFIPGVHYAAMGGDPVHDVKFWLSRPKERGRIAAAGQRLVMDRFTYKHRVGELCRVIEETLT